MPIASPRYPLTGAMVAGAPDDAGVIALWQGDELIYIGSAHGGAVTIRSRLMDFLHKSNNACAGKATHYAWEVASHPAAREAAVLREFETAFGRLPRCNARA